MQPVHGPKRWLGLLVVGLILFAGGGGTGYMLGQQQAQAQHISQLKHAPTEINGKRTSNPASTSSDNRR